METTFAKNKKKLKVPSQKTYHHVLSSWNSFASFLYLHCASPLSNRISLEDHYCQRSGCACWWGSKKVSCLTESHMTKIAQVCQEICLPQWHHWWYGCTTHWSVTPYSVLKVTIEKHVSYFTRSSTNCRTCGYYQSYTEVYQGQRPFDWMLYRNLVSHESDMIFQCCVA